MEIVSIVNIISTQITENLHLHLSSVVKNYDLLKKIKSYDLLSEQLTSYARMTCHARREFSLPKLQYFLNFKYIQI